MLLVLAMVKIPGYRRVSDLFRKVERLPSEPSGWLDAGEKKIPIYLGLIGRIEPAGFGIILDATGKEHAFTFDAIAQYRGQRAGSLELAVGQQVKFAIADEKVTFVEPYIEPAPSSSIAPSTVSFP